MDSTKDLNDLTPSVKSLAWKESHLILLDQTRLPGSEEYLICRDLESLVKAIQSLAVRGAPLIGIAGAYGAALALIESLEVNVEKRESILRQKLEYLENARPTAVNLRWAVHRMRDLIFSSPEGLNSNTLNRVLLEAKRLHDEDIACNRKIANFGAAELRPGSIITVCNTGDLATGGIGTAFGVLHQAYLTKKIHHVYACETRPILQGMRLTTWELARKNIPFTLICDNMAAVVMKKEKISAVIVGADRIAANGDSANKIGTYMLAVLAQAHQIPFYVAAPYSTFDLSIATGDDIPIEERTQHEVFGILGNNQPNFDIAVFNPAFDVTPNKLITGIICDRGVIHQPNTENVRKLLA